MQFSSNKAQDDKLTTYHATSVRTKSFTKIHTMQTVALLLERLGITIHESQISWQEGKVDVLPPPPPEDAKRSSFPKLTSLIEQVSEVGVHLQTLVFRKCSEAEVDTTTGNCCVVMLK
jgi:hypothetical protein